jgi:hypothetical protein
MIDPISDPMCNDDICPKCHNFYDYCRCDGESEDETCPTCNDHYDYCRCEPVSLDSPLRQAMQGMTNAIAMLGDKR